MTQKYSDVDDQVYILVVDDENSIRKLVERTLNPAGFQTQTASNGRQALKYLKETSFDVVISDISMPEMTGIELTKEIVNKYSADVILMTGETTQYHYDEMIGIGASDFVQKPFSPEELISRTNRVLRERRLKEEQIYFHNKLAQAQKMEAMGQLSAGLAHEINTPIQYINDNTLFLKDIFSDLDVTIEKFMCLFQTVKTGSIDTIMVEQIETALDESDLDYGRKEIPQAIDQAIEGIDRIKNIIQAMKVFSHPGKEEHILTDLNQCMQNAITISKNEWKYIADVEADLDPDLPKTRCNPGEINQVFLNLLVNASHAISDKVNSLSGDKGKITIRTYAKKNWVEISISDTGTGIPETVKSKVFDPFFTTKEPGKGTGQGLAISRSIVEDRHHGKISIETCEGKGTTFIIGLPVH
jgi:signal transduction histidine kinase